MTRLTIGSNIDSQIAQRQLSQSSNRAAQVAERLSSGQRINGPSDDAAGAAISTSLDVTKRVYVQGIRNINDGLSALNIAEGALSQLSNITLRQRELAEQAANGSLSLTQRKALNTEAYQLTQEFNRITASTKFNGTTLLDGSINNIRLQSGFGVDGGIGIAIGDSSYRGVWDEGSQAGAVSISVSGFNDNAVGDVNNDGLSDIVTFTSSGAIVVSIASAVGASSGTFITSTKNIGLYSHNYRGQLDDFNNDGKADVLIYGLTGPMYVSLGDGAGNFQNAVAVGSSSAGGNQTAVTADINNDGYLDIVELVQTAGVYQQIHLGRGNGTFQSSVSVQVANSVTLLTTASGDINGDGYADVVIGTGSAASGAFVLYGTRTGTLSSTRYASVTGNVAGIGDINHDGYKDAVFDNGILLGSSTGTSAFQSNSGLVTSINSTKLLDINGDGELDLVATSSSGLHYALGDGNGSFAAAIIKNSYGISSSLYTAKFADFNGDGTLDYVDTGSNVRFTNAQKVGSIARFDILDPASAQQALTTLTQQQNKITGELGLIGSSRSRLETSLANLSSTNTELAAAYSRITDTDVAEESSKYLRENILQQVGAAVLAQANLQPKLVLKLLED